MDEDGEGFEEWDADFLDQVIRVEETALCTPSAATSAAGATTASLPPPSSTSTLPHSSYYLPPQPPPPLPQQSRLFVAPSHSNAAASISYSPPRELSQRTVTRSKTSDQYWPPNGPPAASNSSSIGTAQSDRDKELEIERLKRELGRVSKQLVSRELECTELRKERDNKEEQLKSIFSQTEEKISGDRNLKEIAGASREKEIAKSHTNIQGNVAVESTYKAVGIQTDKAIDSSTTSLDDNQFARQVFSRKLQSVWAPPVYRNVGSSLVSKLFVGCHALLRCVGGDISSKTKLDSLAYGTSFDLDGLGHLQSVTAPDALKVSRFYSVTVKEILILILKRSIALMASKGTKPSIQTVLQKVQKEFREINCLIDMMSSLRVIFSVVNEVSDGTAPLEALLEPLVGLCGCENVITVHRSLCILHLVLKHLFSTERKFEERDNVISKELPEDNVTGVQGSELGKVKSPRAMDFKEASFIPYSSYGLGSSGVKAQLGNQPGDRSKVTYIDWVSLFELLHRIIMKNKEERLRLEAISIMNLILLRSSAYEEREKFGLPIVLESVSELLKKGCGSSVQKKAVHLMFLLLNCPKLLEAFCSFESGHSSSVDGNATATNIQGSAIIMEGLADCLACCGNDIEDLQLRRRAIVLLAYLASSGNAGFQILMNHKLGNGANFLMLILQALVLELDVEASGRSEPHEVLKERTLLMREALILLNRLVSNPLYSSTGLRVLTNSRDMVSLSIDVANRMSKKPLRSLLMDIMNRQPRDTEIVELASSFKRKLYAYLGDGIS